MSNLNAKEIFERGKIPKFKTFVQEFLEGMTMIKMTTS